MAFSGLHVSIEYAGNFGASKEVLPLASKIISSETRTTAGAFAITAPEISGNNGAPIMHFYASADWWVSIGSAPDSSDDPRILIPALTPVDRFVSPGDTVHGTPA